MLTYAMVVVVVIVTAAMITLRRVESKKKYYRIYCNLVGLAEEEVAELSADAAYGYYELEAAQAKLIRHRLGAWYYLMEMQDMSRILFTLVAAGLTPLMLAFIVGQVETRLPEWRLVAILICFGVAFGFGWLVRTYDLAQKVKHEVRRRAAGGDWPAGQGTE